MEQNPIIAKYENFDEEARAFGTRAERIEFTYTKKLLDQYIQPSMSILELGCETGYYGLYLAKMCKTYQGIDLVQKHIDLFNRKINEQGLAHVRASVGDAANLFDVEDDAFDAVLVFGPMYHLPRKERHRVIRESKRVCKSGGSILFAYINKIGAYMRACIDEDLKADYPNKKTNELVLMQGVDDILPNTFFYTMPEEIENDVTENGLSVVQNAGVDFTMNASDINKMDGEKFAAWTEIMDYMFKSASCTGVSCHAVLVCRN